MNDKVFKTLELDKVLDEVARYAYTDTAKNNIKALKPFHSEAMLLRRLDMLEQAVALSQLKGRIPLEGIAPAGEYAVHAQKGGLLRHEALMKISSMLRTVKHLKRFILTNTDSVSTPILDEYAEDLEPLNKLASDIDASIISENDIADTASNVLYDIRRKIKNANSSIKDKLNSIINSSAYRKILQEPIVTLRSGRYVVPVKNECRHMIDGIIHDSSSSGLTIYIEPSAVVALNNKIRELELEQAKEIENILREFSRRVSNDAEYIINNEKIAVMFDELFAKAQYAIQHGHARPLINNEKKISLYGSYHPLLNTDTAVASDIILGEGYTQMVITGPNTGGKTVALKTIGFCVLMAQCALYVPALSGSSTYVFDEVFADIGDEQSIAQSLSTFSSHMTNIIGILSQINSNSLVLLDELGAGTDPSEGAALAKAILCTIKDSGCLSAATTHYNEIKQYALTEEGVVNACMEFDVENLRPTYKLKTGIPGKSNAFEISARLGLSKDIINKASEAMSTSNAQISDVIAKLNEKLTAAGILESKAANLHEENNRLRVELEKEQREFKEKKDKELSDAAIKAKRLIAEAKKTAGEILRQAEKTCASKESLSKIEALSKDALGKINDVIPQHPALEKTYNADNIVVNKGDTVFIPDLGCEGYVIETDKNKALVQVGSIKTKFDVSKLKHVERKKEKQFSYTGMKSSEISPKLDIRGITSTEVALEVEKYIDDAVLAGLKVVTIVHGKGNGILAKEVTKVLKNHPMVENSRFGGLNEGGTGATIVYLQ